MPRFKSSGRSYVGNSSYVAHPSTVGHEQPLQMKHKSSFQLIKHKKQEQQKQMLHGFVIGTVPLTGNDYQEEEEEEKKEGKRSSLERSMLNSGAAKLKHSRHQRPPPIAEEEERDPEMEQAKSRDDDDIKDDSLPTDRSYPKLGNLFGKMRLPKLHHNKKHHQYDETGSKQTSESIHRALPEILPHPISTQHPSTLTIERENYASLPSSSLHSLSIQSSRPLEERVELVAMQDQQTGKPFIRILMSKTAGTPTVKSNAAPLKQPPVRTQSLPRKHMKKKKKVVSSFPKKSQKAASRAAVPSIIAITASTKGIATPPQPPPPSNDPLSAVETTSAARDKALAERSKSGAPKGAMIRVSVAALGMTGATNGLFQRRGGVSKKRTVVKDHTDASSAATPILVPAGYEPPEQEEEEEGQEVVGQKATKVEDKNRSSKKAVADTAASAAAASVYATASTKRLMQLKKKKQQAQAKEEASMQKERGKESSKNKKKKSITSVASTKIVVMPKEDIVVAERELPPSKEKSVCDKVQVMTFLVPSKPQPVEEQVTEADNLSSIGESEETGSGGSTTTSDEISGATEDLRTVASVNPTQLDKFVDEIFNSFTHVDAEDDGDEESDDDEEEEDTVMEMTRLKNQRGLIMSPNATSMNVSDEYIMGHSNTWASAFGWKKQTRKDDERDLRIMESDDSDSLGSYDEEDIPTDYEDFSVDKDEEEGSWYDDVEDDRDDSWDVGSMFKLHKNPSDVYDYDDNMSQVLAKKASSSVRNPKNNSDKKRTKSRGKDPDVDQAMSKLREHAERLGVSERDLVQAMSNPSHPANNLMKNNKKDLLAMQKHDHRGQTRY